MRDLRHFSLALLLGLAACGGDGDSAPGDGGTPGKDGNGSEGAPTVTISPSDGTGGVLIDTPIVLSWSEEMNTGSVEAAWISASLPAGDMVFVWNLANTILTVDASAVLAYPQGGPDVDAFTYEIVLDPSAQDAEGDALAMEVTSQFDTARDITMRIDANDTVSSGTGSLNNGTMQTTPVLRVGDDEANATWRAFLTFDLTTLPENVVEWTHAGLFARQASVFNTPYVDLGSIGAGLISPITGLDITAFGAVARGQVGFSASAAVGDPDGDRTAFVTASIQEDYEAGRTESTFRLDFTAAQDLGNDEDYAVFEAPRLDLRFLAE